MEEEPIRENAAETRGTMAKTNSGLVIVAILLLLLLLLCIVCLFVCLFCVVYIVDTRIALQTEMLIVTPCSIMNNDPTLLMQHQKPT